MFEVDSYDFLISRIKQIFGLKICDEIPDQVNFGRIYLSSKINWQPIYSLDNLAHKGHYMINFLDEEDEEWKEYVLNILDYKNSKTLNSRLWEDRENSQDKEE